MIAAEMQKAYNQTKWAVALRGLLSLAVGIAILARPMDSVAALALVIALWSLFDGMVNIMRSFTLRAIAPHWWVGLLSGIVGVAFGIAALYYFPTLSLTFAIVWTAYWLTFSGVVAIFGAWKERSIGVPWGWTMAFGIVAVIAGLGAFMSPQATLATLLALLAGFAIVSGVVLIVAAVRMGSIQRDVRGATPGVARA
jgi:uncharacterized membrane protein HdeD (DUF308 family)